jgi:hypothetical protein
MSAVEQFPSRAKTIHETPSPYREALQERIQRDESVKHISQGDFAIPMLIHATVPPGVETMKRSGNKIAYEAENIVRGAQLRITTQDAEALTAIYSFLRFQIQDHQTGDSLEVQR